MALDWERNRGSSDFLMALMRLPSLGGLKDNYELLYTVFRELGTLPDANSIIPIRWVREGRPDLYKLSWI